jgi:hypothetical protein
VWIVVAGGGRGAVQGGRGFRVWGNDARGFYTRGIGRILGRERWPSHLAGPRGRTPYWACWAVPCWATVSCWANPNGPFVPGHGPLLSGHAVPSLVGLGWSPGKAQHGLCASMAHKHSGQVVLMQGQKCCALGRPMKHGPNGQIYMQVASYASNCVNTCGVNLICK